MTTTEEPQQYVGFSTIRNPANPNRVFIYRVAADNSTLCFEQRAIQKGVSAPRWNKTPTAEGVPSTTLRGDSNIVTMIFDDVVSMRISYSGRGEGEYSG